MLSDLKCDAVVHGEPKLVVNSHDSYSTPLYHLLLSLRSVGFTRWCSVLVVVGGSLEESTPSPFQNNGIVIIKTTLNGYDFTSLGALQTYRSNPLVEAPAYVVLHDTCLVHPTFVSFFLTLSSLGPNSTLSPQPSGCNIVAFGNVVLAQHGNVYQRNFTKSQSVGIENGQQGRAAPAPYEFGDVSFTQPRVADGVFDVYGTGSPRRLFFLPTFGVYKLILWNQHGDFQGGAKNIW